MYYGPSIITIYDAHGYTAVIETCRRPIEEGVVGNMPNFRFTAFPEGEKIILNNRTGTAHVRDHIEVADADDLAAAVERLERNAAIAREIEACTAEALEICREAATGAPDYLAGVIPGSVTLIPGDDPTPRLAMLRYQRWDLAAAA